MKLDVNMWTQLIRRRTLLAISKMVMNFLNFNSGKFYNEVDYSGHSV
jgi:hypothetical protein